MNWRSLLGKLSFPLLLGVLLLWFVTWWNARATAAEQQRIVLAEAKAADAQAKYDAEHMAAAVGRMDVSNCHIKDYWYTPVKVDGDPRHDQQVLVTRMQCAEGIATIRGALPQLVSR